MEETATPKPATHAPELAGMPGPPQEALSRSQADIMAGWVKDDFSKGRLTPEQADKAFNDLGTPPEGRLPDSRSEEQMELDHLFPPAKPADYRISYTAPGEDSPVMTPELKQFDAAARNWLSEAGMPREIGNSIVNAIAKTVQHTKGMTEEQLDRYAESEYAKLERAYGPSLEAKLREAGRMIEALEKKQPGIKGLLKAHGTGDSALVASLLIQQAERYHARKKR